ncbi:hypothetical protein R5R35_009294 [Gryllus longicercus]|uniref:Uncharacterized protein n=1 Tax=Gryllus longicercus TaxID=2509291 RepID=A0AAN9VXU8_9ORTH
MDKESELAEEKRLNFLLNSSKFLKYITCSNNMNVEKLLLTRSRVRRFNEDFCKYCFRPWNDGFFTLKVRPKPVVGKRIRKLLRKQEEAPGKLTLFQQKLLEFVKLNQGNKLVITCLSCRKNKIKRMPKCNNENTKKEQMKEETREEENTTKVKKKKKRKKDLFVGLNPEVVLKTALNENASVESPNINFKASKPVTNCSKPFNLTSLKGLNLKYQASNLKSGVKKINEECSFNPNDVQSNNNVNSTNNQNDQSRSKNSAFFNNLEIKRRLEQQKKREMQKMITHLKCNRDLREKVVGKEKTEGRERNSKGKRRKATAEKKPDLKNFLRAFGNPVK